VARHAHPSRARRLAPSVERSTENRWSPPAVKIWRRTPILVAGRQVAVCGLWQGGLGKL